MSLARVESRMREATTRLQPGSTVAAWFLVKGSTSTTRREHAEGVRCSRAISRSIASSR
jgi:hypothetical protein